MWDNREEAGRKLAKRLLHSSHVAQTKSSEMIVLSIPRGGVVVGDAVAATLQCTHDMLIVRKIGLPGMEELAIGAVAEDGVVVLDRRMIAFCGVKERELNQQALQSHKTVEHYVELFRHNAALNVASKSVILVDDGIATEETVKAVILWLDKRAPNWVFVAVPVIARRTATAVAALIDEPIYLSALAGFEVIGEYDVDFLPPTDNDVVAILKRSRGRLTTAEEPKSE